MACSRASRSWRSSDSISVIFISPTSRLSSQPRARTPIIVRRMRKLLGTLLFMSVMTMGASVLEFTMKAIDGKQVPLSNFKGQVMLVVNVASQCGYTPQYEGLEKHYETYKSQGFVITGFPANNFGGQEPGSDSEIQTFCKSKYGVTFPMFSKISVSGGGRHERADEGWFIPPTVI